MYQINLSRRNFAETIIASFGFKETKRCHGTIKTHA